jgi:hypothetical protein
MGPRRRVVRPIPGTHPLPWGLARKSAPGGFVSLDAGVRIEAQDRQGLERVLRYCARPPFAAERLEEIDAQRLIYHLPRPGPDGKTQPILSPLELIGRIAALVPPPRQHRHRNSGVLAPNSPLRPAVTALAPAPVATEPLADPSVQAVPGLEMSNCCPNEVQF